MRHIWEAKSARLMVFESREDIKLTSLEAVAWSAPEEEHFYQALGCCEERKNSPARHAMRHATRFGWKIGSFHG